MYRNVESLSIRILYKVYKMYGCVHVAKTHTVQRESATQWCAVWAGWASWCGRTNRQMNHFDISDEITTISLRVVTFNGASNNAMPREGTILSNIMLELVSKTKSKTSNQLGRHDHEHLKTVIVDVCRCIAQSNNYSIHWSGAHVHRPSVSPAISIDLSDWSFQHLSIDIFINSKHSMGEWHAERGEKQFNKYHLPPDASLILFGIFSFLKRLFTNHKLMGNKHFSNGMSAITVRTSFQPNLNSSDTQNLHNRFDCLCRAHTFLSSCCCDSTINVLPQLPLTSSERN